MHNQHKAIEALLGRLGENSYARQHVGKVAAAAQALSDTLEARQGEPAAQHAARLDRMAKQFAGAVQRARAEIDKAEAGGHGALDQAFAQRVGLVTDRYANNIISAFAGMDSQARIKALAQIVEQGDGRSLAAILEAPQFTHGVDRDMLLKFRQNMELRHTPDIAAKREAFEQDTETARAALGAADGLAVEITKATTGEMLDAGARLDQAQQTFSEAVS